MIIFDYEENENSEIEDQYIEPKVLTDYNETNVHEHLNSRRLFSLTRNAARSIFREAHKNKSVSKAFMELEKIFNHIDSQYTIIERVKL